MGPSRCIALVLLALAVAPACGGGSRLTVDLRTNLAPGVEFTSVTVELLASPSGAPRAATVTMAATRSAAASYYAGQRVAELGSTTPGDYDVRVTLLDDAHRLVARRDVTVTIHGDYGLVVLVSRDCNGVTCPGAGDAASATTCFGGRCVDPHCVDGTAPATCGTPECVADTDCPPLAACSVARCVETVCFYEARDTLCAPSEECGIEVGCHGGAPDAGTPDSGTPDSGPVDLGGCMPDCSGRVCGPDPVCGANCGSCGPTAMCGSDGLCMCAPDCAGRNCGTDPRCGTSCGTCGTGELCDGTGNCACAPDCTGRTCGVDPVCGTSCGTCAADEFCTEDDHCFPTNARTQCVSGTASGCSGPRETWTGGVCCVTGVGSCISADATMCTDSAEHWTGSVCCIDQPAACTMSGDLFDCLDPGDHWTGFWCCVDGASRCTTGTPSECDDPAEHYAGTRCCVEGVTSCTTGGSAATCTGHWTGSACCT